MTAYIVALFIALTLAFLRLAATAFEAAVYQLHNAEYRKAWRTACRALLYVAIVAMMLTPVVRWFDSFEIVYDIPAQTVPKPSGLLV